MVSGSALLLGLNPRDDPFLMTVIASFSLGNLTKVSLIGSFFNLCSIYHLCNCDTTLYLHSNDESASHRRASPQMTAREFGVFSVPLKVLA